MPTWEELEKLVGKKTGNELIAESKIRRKEEKKEIELNRQKEIESKDRELGIPDGLVLSRKHRHALRRMLKRLQFNQED